MAFNVVVESCEEAAQPLRAAAAMLAMKPKLLVMLGDDPYYNTPLAWGTWNTTGATTASTSASFKDRVHAMWAKPGWREILAARAAGNLRISWAGGDDHRMADSFDSCYGSNLTTPKGNSETGQRPIGATSQATFNPVITAWYTAHRELGSTYWDYPTVASMASNNGDVPAGPGERGAALPASTFPVIYHCLDFDIDGNVGGRHARLIVPDLITYRSCTWDTDNSSKRMLGAVQEAWFMAAVREAWAAGFQHIVVLPSKKVFNRDAAGRYGNGENSDALGQYTAERDRVWGTLHNEGIRLVNMSGDRHTPQAFYRTVAAHGAPFDCLDMTPCPVGVTHNDTGQGDTLGQTWLRSAAGRYESVFGSLEFMGDGRLRMAIRDAMSGRVRHQCYVAPRSNVPLYA